MTMQTSDKLIYEDYEYEVYEELKLEKYIHEHFSIPPMGFYTTACHRMYHAVFEIKQNNRLYLQEINTQTIDKPVNYTGLIHLYDGYKATNVIIEEFSYDCKIVMEHNLALTLLLQDGIVMVEILNK